MCEGMGHETAACGEQALGRKLSQQLKELGGDAMKGGPLLLPFPLLSLSVCCGEQKCTKLSSLSLPQTPARRPLAR